MSLLGLYLRVRKSLLRLPSVLLLYLDYHRRWRHSFPGATWKHYLKASKEERVYRRRLTRVQKELNRWNEAGWRHIPVRRWQTDPSMLQTPYVCKACKAVDESPESPILTYATVWVQSPSGTWSPYVYHALSCDACGALTPIDIVFHRRHHERRPPQASPYQVMGTYHLGYTVSYGTVVRHRRQERRRSTHELVDTRAEAVTWWDGSEGEPDIAAQTFSDIEIDGVPIDASHRLYPQLIEVMRAYEKTRLHDPSLV